MKITITIDAELEGTMKRGDTELTKRLSDMIPGFIPSANWREGVGWSVWLKRYVITIEP